MDSMDYTGMEHRSLTTQDMENKAGHGMSREERDILSNIKQEEEDEGNGEMESGEIKRVDGVKDEEVIELWVKEEKESDEESGTDQTTQPGRGFNNYLLFNTSAEPSTTPPEMSPWNHNTVVKKYFGKKVKMAARKCHFHSSWMDIAEYTPWLREVKDNDKNAYCAFCKKTFSLGNMGIGAVKSHQAGKIHKSVTPKDPKPQITTYFSSPSQCNAHILQGSTSSQVQGGAGARVATVAATAAAQRSVSMIITDDVLKAEAIWALKVVKSHYSFNSCEGLSDVFQNMFPDSQIAHKFSCGATKCSYLVCFGLSPYFHDQLVEKIKNAKCYSISFDESLNRISQNEQIDFVVRYWDDDTDQVAVRYFGSEFLGCTTAADLMKGFQEGTAQLNPKSLLQISMDGPNVNVCSFYQDLVQMRTFQELPELLNIGSCGLHIVHGSLQKGVTDSGWKLGNIMRCLWGLFHDSTGWREDFDSVTSCPLYPLKFCPHRWVEDARVAERILQMWSHVKKYASHVVKDNKMILSIASFATIRTACEDPFTPAKLEFFISVAKTLQQFLVRFQSDAPMAPFLGSALTDLLSNLLSRFIKKDVLEKMDTYQKLGRLDPLEKKNHVSTEQVDLGFASQKSIKALIDQKAASEFQILQFKTECITFLSSLTSKLLEKCPLKYPLVRHLTCLNPHEIVKSSTEPAEHFGRILTMLLNGKWLSAEQCDELLSQFKSFSTEIKEHAAAFTNFEPETERLDKFLGKYMKGRKYRNLWELLKKLLTISHGQASVERGYSVNKELLIENMQEKSLVALRKVHDAVELTDLMELALTPKLKQNLKAARTRYHQYLDDRKNEKHREDKAVKRRAVQEKIKEAEKKKKIIEGSIETMSQEADELAKKAESMNDFSLLAKSNAFRAKMSEKAKEVACVDKELVELKTKQYNMD
ncbi:hypothetical protein AAFF_G00354980 [Aldrovandia affinis]|uniref:Uncharacterized protein n=1 Tax=Aldrovandia affinis TaxID=143900 RepID=A0AAD7SKP6_9TELE|nr:hypothetical protein AAFF_G00354980 [Aldrovandia affinis]